MDKPRVGKKEYSEGNGKRGGERRDGNRSEGGDVERSCMSERDRLFLSFELRKNSEVGLIEEQQKIIILITKQRRLILRAPERSWVKIFSM